MKSFFHFSLTVVVVALLSLTTFAQSTVTGGIRGSVADQQSAVVPNATITVTNVGTNSEQTTTSDSNGTFKVSNLQPGTYNVVVTQAGFSNFTAEGVVVEVGQTTNIDAALSVAGSGDNVVNVTTDTPVINTDNKDFATNINQTSINELPINGRRVSNFIVLTPATVPDGTFGLISFRGISGLLNNSTIDGGDNNQAFFSEERGRTRINYSISQSAVREFQVNTSNYSSEFGRSAGGVINTVTKSGTNRFSGEAFYYNRNNGNGARSPLAFQSVLVNGVPVRTAVKPKDVRQQFGGAIGGPILKDRLFFFFSYDQQKRNFPGLGVFANGNFLSGFGATGANRTALLTRGLTNTQIDNTLGFINTLTGETPRRGDQKLFLPKLDFQINSNNLLSATYNALRWDSPAGIQTQAVNNLGRRSFGNDGVRIDSLNVRLQSTVSSNILNEARFQYGRDFEYQSSQTPLPGEPLTTQTSFGLRVPNVNLGNNGIAFGTPTFLERPSYPDERRIQIADSVTYTRGRHTFKFGFDFNRVQDDTRNLRFEAGSFGYNNSVGDFIIDYNNFLSPLPTTTQCIATPTRFAGRCYNGNFQQGVGAQGITFTTTEYNFFAQDDFRITPRLTLNLGVRYEYQKNPNTPLANNTLYKDVVIPNTNLTFAQATSQLPNDTNNIGPRVGFAYQLTDDGKTSLRGGYGIYYGRIINSTIYNALINTGNPAGQAQIDTNVAAANAPIFPNVPTATINPNATTPLGAIQYFAPNFQAPLINQYDLILEREIVKNTVVSISYLGSLGRSLPNFVDRNFNQASGVSRNFTVVGGPADGRTFSIPTYFNLTAPAAANGFFPIITRPFGTQPITEIQSSVSSEYNAIVLQANRRFTNGLQFQSSYTFAKATDTGQNSATFTLNNAPLNVFDRSFDSGASRFDVRHKFVVSAVYAPNFFKGSTNSIYNYLFNGFQIAPVYALYSGQPYSANVVGIANGLTGTNGDNRLPILPRNSFRLPRISNLDLRISKRFRFSERYNLEFLAEGFNILNRTNIFSVNTQAYTSAVSPTGGTLTFNQAGFGVTTGTDSTLYRERQIQFSTRFQF